MKWQNPLRKYGIKGIKDTIDAILSLDINVRPLDEIIIKMAAEIFDKFGISPYDCIHVATMNARGIKEIISADKEFDKITNIKRIDPLRYED
ncbi:MAG: type II toxin-antitoxin system VapC family toxin [Thermoplasmata archaeon]|nr:type II toxin-antitoxin system VapC family toxin [Thermoplasmata archaeon]